MKLTGAAILVFRASTSLQAAPAAYPYRSPREGRFLLFGRKDRLAIECELIDTSKPYFFGKVRVLFGNVALGHFSGEIVSTQMFAAEELWQIGQGEPVSEELASCPSEQCIAEIGGLYGRTGSVEAVGERWSKYDFTNRFPYFPPTLCVLLPLQSGHRMILGLVSGRVLDIKLEPGDLDAACLRFSECVQGQPGYGAGTRRTKRST